MATPNSLESETMELTIPDEAGQHLIDLLAAMARKTKVEADMIEARERDELAEPDTHRIYTYFNEMDYEPVKECIDVLGLWSRRDDDKDITILMNSPGGYCIEGYALYDWIVALRKEFKRKVEIVGLGQVSSMASVVMQSASHRVLYKNAWMLVHEVGVTTSDGYYDSKLSIQQEEIDAARRLEIQGTKILAARSNMTAKEITEKCLKHDWWLNPREALEYGLIDEVR